jgi:hypothetical protein
MQRTFGAIAIMLGWLSLLLSAVFGLIATEFMGLTHVEGELPPAGLFGIPSIIVFWAAILVVGLTLVPAAAAIVADDPSIPLYGAAGVIAVVGVVFLFDDLGRAYAAALLPGAAFFGAGGWLMHSAGPIDAKVDNRQTPAQPPVTETSALDTATESSAPIPAEPEPIPAEPAPAPAAPTAEPAEFEPPVLAPAGATPAPPVVPDSVEVAELVVDAEPLLDGEMECPWCSAHIPEGLAVCPDCHAGLEATRSFRENPIPGVTTVAPEYREYLDRVARKKKKPSLVTLLRGSNPQPVAAPAVDLNPEAYRPPSAEVRAEMERISLELAAGVPIPGEPPVAAPEVTPDAAAAPISPAGGVDAEAPAAQAAPATPPRRRSGPKPS